MAAIDIETRVTRIETTLEHLATKADLAQLELRLYVRLGGLMAVFAAAIITAQKLWP